MSSRYFKVKFGFDGSEYIPIEEHELKRAIYAHLTGKKIAFENGSVDGAKIIAVVPDWNKAMGWNAGYKPTPEEQGEIQSEVGKKYHGIIAEAKNQVSAYIKAGTLEKIETPLELSQTKTHTQGLQSIADNLTGR